MHITETNIMLNNQSMDSRIRDRRTDLAKKISPSSDALSKEATDALTKDGTGELPQIKNEEVILKILSSNNLSATDKNIQLADALMQNNMPVDKRTMQTIIAQSVKYEGADIQMLVKMNSLGINVNENSIKQFGDYTANNYQIVDNINKFANEVANAAEKLINSIESDVLTNEGNYAEKLSLLDKIIDIIVDDKETYSQNNITQDNGISKDVANTVALQGSDTGNVASKTGEEARLVVSESLEETKTAVMQTGEETETAVMQTGEGTGKAVMQTGEETGKVVMQTGEETGKAVMQTGEETGKAVMKTGEETGKAVMQTGEETGKAVMQTGEETGKAVMQTGEETKTAVMQTGEETKTAVTKTGGQTNVVVSQSGEQTGIQTDISSKEILNQLLGKGDLKAVLSDLIRKKFSVSPEKMEDPKELNTLYKSLYEKSEKLLNFLESNGQNPGEGMKEAARSMQERIDFMQNLNDMFGYVQLPVNMSEQNVNSDLYVYLNKKGINREKKDISALLHLDMDHLGALDVHVSMTGNTVHTKFYVDDEESARVLDEHMNMLELAVRNNGFDFSNEVIKRDNTKSISVNSVVDEVFQTDLEKSVRRYSFDAKM